MFSVRITSKSAGRLIRNMAAASTYMCSSSTRGNSVAKTRATVSRHSREVSSTLALSTDETLPRRAVASRPARRETRSISSSEYSQVSNAAIAVRPRRPK